jgi:hypothetical protein
MRSLRSPHSRRPFVTLTLVSLSFLAAHPTHAREGFGFFTKATASLVRITPAPVPLLGTKISVQATSADAAHAGLAQRLQSQLETTLLSRDSRLATDAASPETIIAVAVLQNAHSERWERRKEIATREVGKDAKGKPVFQSYEVEVNYKVVSHSFEASYKVTDHANGASLDAGTLRVPFEMAFREGQEAPEAFKLEDSALASAAYQVANRLTPTRESITVLLPKGSLEAIAPLATAGQWNKYLEALEKRSPAANPTDESYHQYALGTAYEALGYTADDPATTLKYLEQADSYYNKALEANAQEKFFSQAYDSVFSSKKAYAPLDRVHAALVNYRRIKDFKDKDEARLAAKDAAGAKELSAPPAAAARLDNAAIVRMVQAGLTDDIVLGAIDRTSERSFDVSPQGLIDLATAKVNRKIILHIQEVMSGDKPSPPAAKAPKKAAAKKPAAAPPHP